MLKSGDSFGRFDIIVLIGTGGMADVYEARDTKLDRVVALKIVRFDDSEADAASNARARLLREARAAAAIVHPNAVAVFDVGDIEGTPYLAMERLRGKTLRHYVGDASVPMKTRLRWLVQIANALDAAHAKGIVHRDVKPENVIITEDGSAKVLDFGLARTVTQVDRSAVTQTGVELFAHIGEVPAVLTDTGIVTGTPDYMAPEQLRGETIDARVDQWAWGITAYELIERQRPWATREGIELLTAILSLEITLSSVAIDDENKWAPAILRALSRDRDLRFPSMAAAVLAVTPSNKRIRGDVRWMATVAAIAAALLIVLVVARSRHRTPAVPSIEFLRDAEANRAERLSSNPEAVGAYRAGLQSQRDGSKSAAMKEFAHASELDDTFAQAHLRWILAFGFLNLDANGHFRKALTYRSSLSEHDNALLEALEPRFASTPDFPQSERRMARALQEHPNDADYLYNLGKFRMYSQDFAGSLAAEDAARAADNTLIDTLRVRGLALASLGRVDEAIASFEECSRASPRATWCTFYRAKLFARDGKCREFELLSRELIAKEPRNPDWDRNLSQALFAQGASDEAVETSLDQSIGKMNPRNEVNELSLKESFAVARGNFAEAERLLHRHFELVSQSTLESDHFLPVRVYANLLTEIGRTTEVAPLVREFLKQRSGWIIEPNETDDIIYAYDSLYRIKAMSRDELIPLRDKWVAAEALRPGTEPAYAWMQSYGQLAYTRADADDALSVLPSYLPFRDPLRSTPIDDWAIGRAYLTGDKPKMSEPFLQRNVLFCNVFDGPFVRTWSLASLSKAAEELGERDRACAVNNEIVRRWGSALPRSTTADNARVSLRRLRCGPPKH